MVTAFHTISHLFGCPRNLKPIFEQFVANYRVTTGQSFLSPVEREKLFKMFQAFIESQVGAPATR
jgi:hypothetical protein